MLVVFVLEREVVDGVFVVFVHPLQAVEDDHGRLVGVRRVVRPHGREGDRVEQAVAVLVLQAFAVERGAAGGAAEQEALGPAVGGGPDQVADPLEAEHRVVDEQRNHVDRRATRKPCRRR